MRQNRVAWTGLLLVAVSTSSCQWVSDLIPTQATPSPSPSVSPAAVSPLTIPVILPTPSPTPTPTPGPTPSPSPTPGQGACNLPPSTPANYACFAETILFLDALDASITEVTRQYPQAFDFNNKNCDNCYYVRDAERYHLEVTRQLQARGFCTYFDGEEVGIKNSNAFNEQYDIHLSTGYIRRGRGTYMGTCRPAWF